MSTPSKWTSLNCLVQNLRHTSPSVLAELAHDALDTVEDHDETQEDVINSKCRLIVAALLVERDNNGWAEFGKALQALREQDGHI